MNETVTQKHSYGLAVEPPFSSHVALPIVCNRKWKKKALLSEVEQGFQCASTLPALRSKRASVDAPCKGQASFMAFPFFVMHNWAHEVQRYLRRLLLLTFLGEARKVSGRRATPDQRQHY
ncbi:hypothetical protein [Undibacterium sp. Di24W]|uniref:hypothetical protein n=1 Tax=Undibacterium sp. Di24W TaxID=3413033 RepID=UPI003BF3175B